MGRPASQKTAILHPYELPQPHPISGTPAILASHAAAPLPYFAPIRWRVCATRTAEDRHRSFVEQTEPTRLQGEDGQIRRFQFGFEDRDDSLDSPQAASFRMGDFLFG